MWCGRLLLKAPVCVFGESSSQLTCGKLKLLKQSLLASFSPTLSLHSFTPPLEPHTYLITFFLVWQLPPTLSLILQYYSSLSLSLTLFLSCYPLPTLSPGCSLNLHKLLSARSLSTVLSIYLSFVAWTCHCLVTRDRFLGSCDGKSEHLSYYFCDRVALSGSEVSRLACLCSVSHGVPIQNRKTTPESTNMHLSTQRATTRSWEHRQYCAEMLNIFIISMTRLRKQRFSMLQVQRKELNLRGLANHLERRDSGVSD